MWKASARQIRYELILKSRVNFMVKLLRACVWMPWRKKAKKDVASCEKPRGDASNLRSGDVRMGKPERSNPFIYS
jgi:hypothetical protein